MMPNVMQYPVALAGSCAPAARVTSIRLHAARARAQLKDSGAEAIFILENFAHVFQQVATRCDQGRRGVRMGDMLVPQGAGHFVVRNVKKMVPSTRCRTRALSE